MTICGFGRAFLTRPEIVSTLSRPPWAAGGILIKVMDGVSESFSDVQAIKANR
jgi:hypothetical protein